jgi:hypothetical protein
MTVLFHGLIAFTEAESLMPQTPVNTSARQTPNVERQTCFCLTNSN